MKLRTGKQNKKELIWAFSNENIARLCEDIRLSGKKIIGIGGAGDQGLSFLSEGAESYLAVDKRKHAVQFLRLKKAMVSYLKYQDFTTAFKGKIEAKKIFRKVKKDLAQREKNFWADHLNNDRVFLQALKKSELFYNRSFRNFKRRKFFPYLSPSGYESAQRNEANLKIMAKPMENVLAQGQQKFDIIYFSNILDSAFQRHFYLEDAGAVLSSARSRLTNKGTIIAATLVKRKLLKVLDEHGFKVTTDISPKFPSFLYYLATSRYPYSFLIAQKRTSQPTYVG